MTTLNDFAPKTNWGFYAERFSDYATPLTPKEIKENCKFFEDNVRKGCYGNCEALYKENEIRSMGYAYRPDMWFKILVYLVGIGDYVTRYLPGRQEDYTVAQIDKWVREFDGESNWCVKPAMRWVPDLKDEGDLYDVDPNARPTITNDSF